MNPKTVVFALLAGAILLTAPGLQRTHAVENREMPTLTFVEVLNVIATGVQMEKQVLIKRDPALRKVMRDAAESLGRILEKRLYEPEQVFGTLQTDLGHHEGREFAVFIQSF